jgi:hypothetical protein
MFRLFEIYVGQVHFYNSCVLNCSCVEIFVLRQHKFVWFFSGFYIIRLLRMKIFMMTNGFVLILGIEGQTS